MARINLLPWRKEQRERKNKEFNTLAAATAGVAALLVILALSFLNKELSNQEEANQRIKDANTQLDVALKSIEELESKREQMLAQMKVIQDLQGRRSIPVRVWDDMARAVPDAMYLNNIKRVGEVITLTGFADNPNVVAALVRNLNASEWLDASAVVSIKSSLEAYQNSKTQTTNKENRPAYPEDNYVEFVVTTKVQNPQTEEEKKAKAEGENGDVPLPPITTEAGAMPEVAPIGVDSAPAPTANAPAPANNAPATPSAPANAPASVPAPAQNNGANQPASQPAPTQGATVQNEQPVANNSITPAGEPK